MRTATNWPPRAMVKRLLDWDEVGCPVSGLDEDEMFERRMARSMDSLTLVGPGSSMDERRRCWAGSEFGESSGSDEPEGGFVRRLWVYVRKSSRPAEEGFGRDARFSGLGKDGRTSEVSSGVSTIAVRARSWRRMYGDIRS